MKAHARRSLAEEEMGNGEDEEGKDREDEEGWGLLEQACRYYESRSFKDEMDEFVREHAEEFIEGVGEEEKTGEHTHRIRYTELHEQYLQLLEALLYEFLAKAGHTAEDLFSALKDAQENKYCALFEEHRYNWFVQVLLAALQYPDFYSLMLRSAKDKKSDKRDRNRDRGSYSRTERSATDDESSSYPRRK